MCVCHAYACLDGVPREQLTQHNRNRTAWGPVCGDSKFGLAVRARCANFVGAGHPQGVVANAGCGLRTCHVCVLYVSTWGLGVLSVLRAGVCPALLVLPQGGCGTWSSSLKAYTGGDSVSDTCE